MARWTVGSVPFLNARPLVRCLEAGDSPVAVRYAPPSRLPALLESGAADAILVSSLYALSRPGRSVVEGTGIASRREVLSVRLFSRVPFERIERLALDPSSMTSNALARIVLAELYGARPEARIGPVSRLDALLEDADAAILIGDAGMSAEAGGLRVLDLGEAWHELTGLPFVWALWVGGPSLDPALAAVLDEARAEGVAGLDAIVSETTDFPPDLTARYLREVMEYEMAPEHWRALSEFGRLALRHGAISECFEPRRVRASRERDPSLATG